MFKIAKRGKRAFLYATTALIPFCLVDVTQAQEELPEIKVTAPSPIVRRAPVRPRATAPVRTVRAPTARAPAAPAPAPAPVAIPLQGTLPIVTDQFATVT